jgi:hypothetical protein
MLIFLRVLGDRERGGRFVGRRIEEGCGLGHAGRAWLEVCIVAVDGVEGNLGVGHISLLGFSIWLDSHLLVQQQVCSQRMHKPAQGVPRAECLLITSSA